MLRGGVGGGGMQPLIRGRTFSRLNFRSCLVGILFLLGSILVPFSSILFPLGSTFVAALLGSVSAGLNVFPYLLEFRCWSALGSNFVFAGLEFRFRYID